MREIKFRAWLQRWDSGKSYYSLEGIDYYFFEEWGYRTWKDVECAGHKLMQYTGLKDKNGKEIYEGDILKLGNDKRAYWVVKEDSRDDLPRGFTMVATYPQYMHPHVKETHVIGNIYENPELAGETE